MLEPLKRTLPQFGLELPTREEAAKYLDQLRREGEVVAHREQLAKAQRAIGLPVRFASASLSDWPTTTDAQARVLEVARRFAAGFANVLKSGNSLVFLGNVGSGKTRLACSIANAITSAGYSAAYTKASKAFRRVKETWRDGADESETDATEALAKPDLLILDEVGVQYGSKTEVLMLTELIDDRYAALRPTILISNLPRATIDELVDARAADRLRQGGMTLRFDWPSFRTRGAEA